MSKIEKLKVLDWIEEAERLPAKPARPKRTYDERLVAYIDVLGMSERVRKEDAEWIVSEMGKLRVCVGSECEPLTRPYNLKFLQLGDGFIIVADLNCITELCEVLSKIQWRVLVYNQMLLRGALTAGKVWVDEDYIVGPAFLDAFTLESRNAIYPRIIFADEIRRYVPRKLIKFGYIREDNDRFSYLDFIGHNIDSDKHTGRTLDHLLTTRGAKAKLKSEYESYLVTDKVIAQKYGWVIAKLASHKISIM